MPKGKPLLFIACLLFWSCNSKPSDDLISKTVSSYFSAQTDERNHFDSTIVIDAYADSVSPRVYYHVEAATICSHLNPYENAWVKRLVVIDLIFMKDEGTREWGFWRPGCFSTHEIPRNIRDVHTRRWSIRDLR